MKIIQSHRNISSSEGLNSVKFGMDITAKSFQILISKLYTDKILAIIREISTNAYDSHVANGNKNMPFLVHLPTLLEPTFYVRDYGTGLSDEELKNIYIVCFRSNKTNDNNATGCLGLGSKSPLSYVDSFTLDSYKDGKHYSYILHYDSENIPVLTHVGTYDTNERNGLKVSIAVKYEDIEKFVDKSKTVYSFFEVCPTFIGKVIDVHPKPSEFIGKNWRASGTHGNCYAVMSNVGYIINQDNVYFTEQENLILKELGLWLYVDNGDISFEPSRERISLDKNTVAVIKNRLSEVVHDLGGHIQKKIDAALNLYEARLIWSELENYFEITKTIPTYNSKELSLKEDVDNFDIKKTTTFGDRSPSKSWYININKHNKYIELDCELPKNYRKTLNHNFSYINNIYLIKFKDKNEKRDFCKIMGFDESYIKPYSLLPKAPKAPKSQSAKHDIKNVRTFNNSSYFYKRQNKMWWIDTSLDKDKTKPIYYVILKNYKIIYNQNEYPSNGLKDVAKTLNKLNCKIENIFGITETQYKFLKKENYNLVCLFTEINKIVDNHYQQQQFNNVLEYKDDLKSGNVTIFQYLNKIANKLNKNHSIYKTVKFINEYNSQAKDSFGASINFICNTISYFNINNKQRKSLNDLIEIEKKNFPLIACCDDLNNDGIEDIIWYLETKHKLKGKK